MLSDTYPVTFPVRFLLQHKIATSHYISLIPPAIYIKNQIQVGQVLNQYLGQIDSIF